MIKRIAAFLMMSHLLAGSIVLPLGDFSLLKDLPRMYSAYEKVVSPEEKGVVDFVGDYLLFGKDLLGHNKHDQPSRPGDTQFQHSATFATVFHPVLSFIQPLLTSVKPVHFAANLFTALSDYHPTLFRPPLA